MALRFARPLHAVGDDRLAVLGSSGDRAVFAEIYSRHHRGILSLCRHLLGSHEEAEDAVQDTFASAYRDLVRRPRERRLRPWLYTIARNRCLTVLRARREQPSDTVEVSTAGLSEQVERRADLRDLVGDLARLPEQQRAALILAELDDLEHAEVAQVLGCDKAKVRALVFQARTGLAGWRQAREAPCGEIRDQVAWGRGGVLRRRTLRRHLEVCPGCAGFARDVGRHRAGLAVVLPALPSAGLRDRVLEAVEEVAAELGLAAAGGAGAAGGSAAGVAGGGAAVGAGWRRGLAGWRAVRRHGGQDRRGGAGGRGRADRGRGGARRLQPDPRKTTRAPRPARPRRHRILRSPSRGRSGARGSAAPQAETPGPGRLSGRRGLAERSRRAGTQPLPAPVAQPPAATPPQQGAGQPRQESGAGGLRIDLDVPEVRVPALPDPQVRAPDAPPVRTPELPPRVPARAGAAGAPEVGVDAFAIGAARTARYSRVSRTHATSRSTSWRAFAAYWRFT